MAFVDAYRGKRVLVTGHTGFKGSWLTEWLVALGAKVTGFALPPDTQPSLFEQLRLSTQIDHRLGDVRDLPAVRRLIEETRPDFVFHLAAQPLVRRSYLEPVETYATNVMGTAHVLEAVRLVNHPCTLVAITTDKCYENKEWLHAYREDDPMGGYDPYSSSKGAAELVISAYRRSYFSTPSSSVRLASARAGNVIGGGDWAENRIVPDCIRALARNEPVVVRNKTSTRPWQHVLEPLSGYLWLASRLHDRTENIPALASGFNFGPAPASNRTVAALVDELLQHWPGSWLDRSDPHAPHEAGRLNLAIDKAFHLLNWGPTWGFSHTVEQTVNWYRLCNRDLDAAAAITRRQIAEYTADAKSQGQCWAS